MSETFIISKRLFCFGTLNLLSHLHLRKHSWSSVEVVGESACRSPQSSCTLYWNVCKSEQDYQPPCLVGKPISDSSDLGGHHCPKSPLVSETSPRTLVFSRTDFCSACTVSISSVSVSTLPYIKDFYMKGPYTDTNLFANVPEPLFHSSQIVFIC